MRHQITKDDVKAISKMWEKYPVVQIAEFIGCSKNTVYTVGRLMKEAGYKIQYKKQKGLSNALIMDAIEEL